MFWLLQPQQNNQNMWNIENLAEICQNSAFCSKSWKTGSARMPNQVFLEKRDLKGNNSCCDGMEKWESHFEQSYEGQHMTYIYMHTITTSEYIVPESYQALVFYTGTVHGTWYCTVVLWWTAGTYWIPEYLWLVASLKNTVVPAVYTS